MYRSIIGKIVDFCFLDEKHNIIFEEVKYFLILILAEYRWEFQNMNLKLGT